MTCKFNNQKYIYIYYIVHFLVKKILTHLEIQKNYLTMQDILMDV